MATFSDLLIGLVLTVAFIVLHGSLFVTCVINESLCSRIPHCYHNQSGLCTPSEKGPISCTHQLKNKANEGAQCWIERSDPSDCYIATPSDISGPDELPFVLQMYYHRTWMESRAVVNLTFPTPTWHSAKFQYQAHENRTRVLCREITLTNVSLPLMDDLMWDCPFFDGPYYLNRSFDLSVITSEGIGGKYAFRVPEKKRFDPVNTKLKDWQVFFFLHIDHIHHSVNLPVTVQLVPFRDTSILYNISLMKCLQDDYICDQRSTLTSILLENPEMNATSLGDTKQITPLLQSWSTPATYIVSVQIVSPDCPEDGCFISLSPVFVIKRSQIGLWISVAFVLFVMFVFAYIVTLHHRTKANKKLLTSLKYNQPSVLLLYLPENDICLELVEMFASFLKEKCYVHPYVIDTDVGSQNPNTWTSEHMNTADKLLFIVPGNPNGISVTPRRDQWLYALQYFSGHYFFTNHAKTKSATVLLPFSADVPHEIGNVRRFNLVSEMPSLVTWIHGGSWLDQTLLWGPEIRSASKNSDAPSVAKLLEIVDQASQETKCHKGVGKTLHSERNILESDNFSGIDTASQAHARNNDCKHKLIDTEDSSDTDLASECGGNEFDPNIASAQDILERSETPYVDESDNDSDNSSGLDDAYFL